MCLQYRDVTRSVCCGFTADVARPVTVLVLVIEEKTCRAELRLEPDSVPTLVVPGAVGHKAVQSCKYTKPTTQHFT